MTTAQRFFNIQTFNNSNGELLPLTIRTIGYRRDRRTDNYILVYTNPLIAANSRYHRQEIVVQSEFFARVVPAAVKSDTIAGCTEILPAQFAELGFINHDVKEAVRYDARLSVC